MNRKSYTLVLVAAAALAVPTAYADDMTSNSMEQRGEQAQAKVKDAWLHGKLEATLLFNEHLNSFAIDSDVKNGIAYLRGVVESDIDRDLAGEIAKSIAGVTSVENELIVDKAKAQMARSSDESKQSSTFKQSVLNATLTARIKSQLLVNGNTAGMDINVDSNNGVVTLSGEVVSDQERELAVRIAGNANGTKSVNDRLTVAEAEKAE